MGDHHGAILVVFFAAVPFAGTNQFSSVSYEGLLDLAIECRPVSSVGNPIESFHVSNTRVSTTTTALSLAAGTCEFKILFH